MRLLKSILYTVMCVLVAAVPCVAIVGFGGSNGGGGGGGGGGGYTNLTQFVDQTAWRMFYSDGSGDVKELALGAAGKVLQANGATSAPTFETPASGFTAASVAEINTGTENAKGATPLGLQTSKYNSRLVQLTVDPHDALLVVGDVSEPYRVPLALNGATLIAVGAAVGDTYSSSGTPTFKIEKVHLSAPGTRDAAVQMLTTNLTIDASEYDSSTAATAAVISAVAGAAQVATGDILTASCVTAAGTGTKGGVVSLNFQMP